MSCLQRRISSDKEVTTFKLLLRFHHHRVDSDMKNMYRVLVTFLLGLRMACRYHPIQRPPLWGSIDSTDILSHQVRRDAAKPSSVPGSMHAWRPAKITADGCAFKTSSACRSLVKTRAEFALEHYPISFRASVVAGKTGPGP